MYMYNTELRNDLFCAYILAYLSSTTPTLECAGRWAISPYKAGEGLITANMARNATLHKHTSYTYMYTVYVYAHIPYMYHVHIHEREYHSLQLTINNQRMNTATTA